MVSNLVEDGRVSLMHRLTNDTCFILKKLPLCVKRVSLLGCVFVVVYSGFKTISRLT